MVDASGDKILAEIGKNIPPTFPPFSQLIIDDDQCHDFWSPYHHDDYQQAMVDAAGVTSMRTEQEKKHRQHQSTIIHEEEAEQLWLITTSVHLHPSYSRQL